MKEKEPSNLPESQLEGDATVPKSEAIIHAVLIGFLIGIIIYSIAVNSVGLFTLIPLYLIYRLIKKPKKEKTTNE